MTAHYLTLFSAVMLTFAAVILAKELHRMSQATDRLAASAAALSTSVDAAVTALGTHADDSAALNAVSDSLDATRAKLDAAVSATIPAPPPAE